MCHKLYWLGISTDILPKRVTGSCKMYFKDAMIVDPEGNVFSCNEYPLTDDVSHNPNIQLGNVKKPYSIQEKPSPSDILMLMDKHRHPCVECEILPVCGGECVPHWNRGLRQCPDFRYYLPELLAYDYLFTKTLISTS